ncbi:MAG TPA: hypothetical protein VF615_17010 [Longimicrobiaceae bacterium]|jgi:hypothetical protein
MDSTKELLFLLELRYLADTSQWHAEHIKILAAAWTDTHGALRKPKPKSQPQFSLADPRSYFEQLRDATNEQTRERRELLNQSINAQWEIFARVDAFLALYGRIALILFPQEDKKNPKKNLIQQARAAGLRSALRIDTNHPFSERVLRNKWVHFDETIDKVDGEVSLQRFVHSSALREIDLNNTVRLFVVDTLKIVYQGQGNFELEQMFASVDDIRNRTLQAIETWGKRWEEELASEG